MTSSPSAKDWTRAVVLAMPGNEQAATQLAQHLPATLGDWNLHRFPDGESLVQVLTEVKDRPVIIVCTLHQPDPQFLPLHFLALTCRDLGAAHVCLLAPYLAYMRQDKRFHAGEGITSLYFAKLLSGTCNSLVTVDPHLHRWHALSEIYTIETQVIHAAEAMASWVREHVPQPVLIGPDSESEQWVAEVARLAGCPFRVLEKTRQGDKEVEIALTGMEEFRHLTPVLIDDIISSARTMVVAVQHLLESGLQAPVCVGVHPIFAGDGYEALQAAGAARIVTCNTIPHPTNGIDLTGLYAQAIRKVKL